ncbi:anthrone oxygenase family protein [Streptomyces sp. NPDC093544]|uniref:anthrone oxygenase family protein n=1 Tax=Streptomyces sp. NPDC093544 TaxID=3155200 RepID=UPI003444CA68
MLNSPVAKVARWAGLFFSGLFAGFLVAVLVLELSLRGFDRQVYTQVRQVELESLDKLAVATLLPALIATALLVALTFKAREVTPWLTLAALTLLVGVLALTLAVNLPINADQLDWNVQAPPADWATVRDHWQIAHGVRTGAAVLALGALIANATGTPRRTRHETPTSTHRGLPAASEDSPLHQRT